MGNKINWNYSKNCFIYNIFYFQKLSNNFCECIKMESQGHKNENIERKYLQNMKNNQFSRIFYS